MVAKGQIDRVRFAEQVTATLAHPSFPQARLRFAREVSAARLHSPFRRILTADTGAFALVIAVTGLNRIDKVHGAALMTVVQALTHSGFASATRVRALIDQMVDRGLMAVETNPDDRRRKRLLLTEPFLAAERDWFEAVLSSVALVYAVPGSPGELAQRDDVLERYLTSVMLRSLLDDFTLMEGMPEIEAFMNRRHGYLLMLHLGCADGRRVEVHRTAMARSFGVSAAHIAVMLSDAEAAGWLKRDLPSNGILLSEPFAQQLDVWIARELVIVGMWVEAKYGRGGGQETSSDFKIADG